MKSISTDEIEYEPNVDVDNNDDDNVLPTKYLNVCV